MYLKEVMEIWQNIKKDKAFRLFLLVLFTIISFIAIFFSSLSAIIVLFAFQLGFVTVGVLLKYEKQLSLHLNQLACACKGHFSPESKVDNKTCSICTGTNCNRHLFNNKTPWKSLHIDKNLNNALENFFNRIINQFILSWYQVYTPDKTFINELKSSLRYALASAISRFLQLDVGQIITSKLVPCAIKHVDDYLCMMQIAELKNVHINQVAVEFLGKRLHIAASSRKNEILYLKNLSSSLLERVLSPENLKCRNFVILMREIISGWVLLPLMDVLADPNIINSLVILATTYKSKAKTNSCENKESVEFLLNFSKHEFGHSALASDLKTILKNPQLLYAYMQFLKQEGVVHLLNFCLDVESFNCKLLTPDLSKKQLESLHSEALNIYKIYFDSSSVDFIECSESICLSLNSVLDEGMYNIAKLQTSDSLIKAYDVVYNALETKWLPQFYHSKEFFVHICGSKVTSNYTKASSQRHKRFDTNTQGPVSKFSSGIGRIKGALQTKPIEGSMYPHISKVIETDSTSVDDIFLNDTISINRDMSSWRITIPIVDTHQIGSKTILTFNVSVEMVEANNEGESWIVKRRDQDFYTLKLKLIEFHGENEICNSPLPSRRATMSVDMRRLKYEDFLRRLLQKSLLKGSDLLYTFLTSPEDFTLVTSTSVPMVDLENIYQSVSLKLRKEKGQHLDSFMNTFLHSIGHQKLPKFEWAEVSEEMLGQRKDVNIQPKTLKNPVFENNFDVTFKIEHESSSSSINPNGITEATFYLLKHIFKIPFPALKLYVAICSIAQQAVESLVKTYIERKLKHALSQPTLAFLIKELEEVIFQKFKTETPEELLKRQEEASLELKKSIPNFLDTIMGGNIKEGATKLLSILQNPLYNKQLAYNLIDIVVSEMYPELDTTEEFY